MQMELKRVNKVNCLDAWTLPSVIPCCQPFFSRVRIINCDLLRKQCICSGTRLPKAAPRNILTCIIIISLKKQYYLKVLLLFQMGLKSLSIFISPLDLFWTVIKAHLPLRISIMIFYTLLYTKSHRLLGLATTSLIKSVELWIYSKACTINEGKDSIQYLSWFHSSQLCSDVMGEPREPEHLQSYLEEDLFGWKKTCPPLAFPMQWKRTCMDLKQKKAGVQYSEYILCVHSKQSICLWQQGVCSCCKERRSSLTVRFKPMHRKQIKGYINAQKYLKSAFVSSCLSVVSDFCDAGAFPAGMWTDETCKRLLKDPSQTRPAPQAVQEQRSSLLSQYAKSPQMASRFFTFNYKLLIFKENRRQSFSPGRSQHKLYVLSSSSVLIRLTFASHPFLSSPFNTQKIRFLPCSTHTFILIFITFPSPHFSY